MSGRRRQRGAANMAVLVWIALCLLGFAVTAWLAVLNVTPVIQDQLLADSYDAIAGAPGVSLHLDVDGRSVRVRGRVGSSGDRRAVTGRLVQVEGIVEVVDDLTEVRGLRWQGGEPAPGTELTTSTSGSAWTGDGSVPAAKPVAPPSSKPAAKTRAPPHTPRAVRPRASSSRAASKTRRASTAAAGPSTPAGTISFGRGSAYLNDAGRSTAARVARAALASPNTRVHVSGHADDAGTAWDNHDLSANRAAAVARALVAAGVPASRIRQHVAGDQYPVAAGRHPANRRAELALQESSR
jgi:outer membrane protein OmpA-like peptidoglycan-associated protein